MSVAASNHAIFVQDGAAFVATELARGPWSPDAQHGGAAAALLMREFEQLDGPGLVLSRVTYEFVRPVPLGDLNVTASVIRPGKRVQLLEGSIQTPDGTEVVIARALRIKAADSEVPTSESAPPPGPEQGRDNEFRSPYRPMFAPDAIEIKRLNSVYHEAAGLARQRGVRRGNHFRGRRRFRSLVPVRGIAAHQRHQQCKRHK